MGLKRAGKARSVFSIWRGMRQSGWLTGMIATIIKRVQGEIRPARRLVKNGYYEGDHGRIYPPRCVERRDFQLSHISRIERWDFAARWMPRSECRRLGVGRTIFVLTDNQTIQRCWFHARKVYYGPHRDLSATGDL